MADEENHKYQSSHDESMITQFFGKSNQTQEKLQFDLVCFQRELNRSTTATIILFAVRFLPTLSRWLVLMDIIITTPVRLRRRNNKTRSFSSELASVVVEYGWKLIRFVAIQQGGRDLRHQA
jgi:hypothetical protein